MLCLLRVAFHLWGHEKEQNQKGKRNEIAIK